MIPSKRLLLASLILAAPTLAQQETEKAKDSFPREGAAAKRVAKDALEGQTPPPLRVQDWMNTDGKELTLAELRGKVVLLDFWGVW